MKRQKLIKYMLGIEIGVISLLLIGWEYQIPTKISSFLIHEFAKKENSIKTNAESIHQKTAKSGEEESEEKKDSEIKKEYIKWVDFQITCTALEDAYQYDVESYGTQQHIDWVDLLSCLACQNGGDFKRYKSGDMKSAINILGSEEKKAKLSQMKYFDYYREAYGAVLSGMVGKYKQEKEGNDGKKEISELYGLKAYSPIAKGFPYSHFDDFGTSRSYGYQRQHLGHDMLGQVGTPVIAIESGYVKALGWNQYGGWRIGINSFDGKRYYYYAHLRQNRPYAEGLELGNVVTAGDVIGYMGRTGYSATENVNNIQVTHLHWGLQLIFDESQREGNNEIWVDVYPLTQFLSRHQSEAVRNDETKEWTRKERIIDPAVGAYEKNKTSFQ